MLSKAFSAAAQGVDTSPVNVEVDSSQGMPKEQLVGLPDAAVKESLHRVRAAMTNAGYSAWRNPLSVFTCHFGQKALLA